MLIARLHKVERSGITYLRVGQDIFRQELKDRLQRIGSPARWLPAEQAWQCPLTPAAVIKLGDIARELGEAVQWNDGLQQYADEHLKRSDYEHEVRLAIERIMQAKAPLEPYVTLMQRNDGSPCPPLWHQSVSYHWSIRVRGILLAHEMGCGKTRSAVDASGGWYRTGQIQPMQATVIHGRPAVCGGVLVVCPKTMLQTWQEELARWQNAHAIQIKGEAVRKARLAGTPSHYHIINYEALKYVEHSSYDGIILDESHKIAGSSAQAEKCLAIGERVKKKICLTGTPISNDLKSIFNQMLFVDGGRALGPSRTAFLEKYFNETRGRGGFFEYEEKEDATTEIARAIATSCYFLKKEDCLDLPPKTHTPLYLPMADEQARYYRQIKNEAITYIQDATVTVEQASARMMKLLQVCQGFALTDLKNERMERVGRHFSDAKTEALMEMLTDQLRGRKVIVWTMFQYEQQRLADLLAKAGINFVRIDGTITSQTERDAAKHRWNTDSSVTVFIRQLSMSEGVTLLGTEDVPCFTTVYLGLTYSMVHLLQSQDRVHRIGQKYACSYIYLLTENGVDRSVYNRLLEKVENANAVQHTGKHYYASLLADQPDKAA